MREPVFLLALAIAGTTAIMVARSIAAAISGRLGSRSIAQLKDQVDQHSAALEEAEVNLAHQSAQLAELQERLDFTERLLARDRDRPEIGPGDNAS